MALSFAGTQLALPTPEAAAWVEKNISTRDLYPWDVVSRVSSVRVGLTTTGQLDARRVRLNTLRWPVGACEWATCFLLASTGQVGEILGKVYTDSSMGTGTLVLTGPRGQVETEMFLLPPRPLAQLPYANGMWLLPLVDERYFWWQKTTGDLKSSPPTTWADWITLLGGLIGTPLQLSRPTPSTYLYPSGSPDLGLSYVDLAPVLDSVAFNIGCRVVRGLDGTVTLQDPLAAAQAQQGQYPQGWPVLAGGKLPLPAPSGTGGPAGLQWWNPQGSDYAPWAPPAGGTAAGVIPLEVEVTFPTSTSPATLTSLTCTPAGTGASDLAPLGTGPGTKTFRSGVDTTNSASARQQMTNQLATDWFRWQLGQLDVVFAGVIPWAPEGFDDVEWTYRPDMVSTRVCRLPYNDLREELLHNVTSGSGGGPQPVTHLTLPSASNDVDVSGGAAGGFLWLVIDSAPSSPSTINNLTGGVAGQLVEVTNASGKDIKLSDAGTSGGNILCPTNVPPAGNSGPPAALTLHDRETVWVKFDGTAGKWRVFERLPHVLVGSNEYARSRIQFDPCCTMGIWPTDDAANDTVKLQFGTVGKTTTVTVVSAVDFVAQTVTSHVLTFNCGVLTLVDGA